MENITKIYIDSDLLPAISHYNGSWNVIKHESTDGLDYSIMIWDTIYEGIYNAEESLGYELSDEEWTQEAAFILQYISDSYNIELLAD